MDLTVILDNLPIDNIYIYVADAVRWDALPDSIAARGATVKTLSSSIHSPPSFASIATGCYPLTHGVFWFDNSLPVEMPTIFDLDQTTAFVNENYEEDNGQDVDSDPFAKVMGVETSPNKELIAEADDPFVLVERSTGGHAPYSPTPTAWEYFEANARQPPHELRREYRQKVSRDAERFERRLELLRERGLDDRTLVIYTADHGELLGEGGLLGHNSPIQPELVHIPTVFIHPEIEPCCIKGIIRQVDLYPTVADLMGQSVEHTDGVSLRSSQPSSGIASYNSKVINRGYDVVPTLTYHSYWDDSGGYVFNETARRDRLAAYTLKFLKSPKRGHLRQNFVNSLSTYLRGDQTFGLPRITKQDARDEITAAKERTSKTGNSSTANIDTQLKDLGYL